MPIRGLLAAAALVLAGCASELPTTRVVFARTAINGRPARILLDTGSSSTLLFDAGARRLGLKGAGISEPAPVTMDGQTFTAPFPIFHLPWLFRLFGGSSAADGVVGWPETRDNILVFDAGQRMIRSVEQLPPETALWLKLKIVPDPVLLLETPLGDGTTGTILVDTGAPDPVQMSPAQWKQWKAAHPKARLTCHRGDTASFGAYRFQAAWADQINLGALTLSDLAVENMSAGEAQFLQKEAPAAKAVWALGMYALLRMDLVVDWKGGFAYLHPKPPPGPPYPLVKRPNLNPDRASASNGGGNWTVAENVRLSRDNLFVMSGEDKWSKNDFAGALAEFTHALELNPNNADAYSDRGAAWEIQGDFADAVSDYNKVIQLRPEDSDYERLFRQTLWWRLGRKPEDFSNTLPAFKGAWTKTVGLFLSGGLDEKSLLQAAKKSDVEPVSGQKCEACYYIGMVHLSKGDKGGARHWFQKCRARVLKDYNEYQFAGAELARLEAPAN